MTGRRTVFHERIEAYEAARQALPAPLRPINAACLQGLLSAAMLSPEMVMPSVWLPLLWDLNQTGPGPVPKGSQAKALLDAALEVHADVADSLGPARRAHLRPCYHYLPGCTLRDFCLGFQAGRRFMAEDWAQLLALRPAWFEPFERFAAQASETDAHRVRLQADAIEVNLLRMHDYFFGLGAEGIDRYREPEADAQRIQRVSADIQRFTGFFPFAAVEEARQHQQAVSNELLACLQRVVAAPDLNGMQDVDLNFELPAALLGEWRDERAFEPLLAMASFDEATLESLWGDSLNTLYMRALASTCAGRHSQMRALITNASAPPFVRLALLEAWQACVLEGDAEQGEWEAVAWQVCEAEAQRLRALPAGKRDDNLLALTCANLLDMHVEKAAMQGRQWLLEGLFHEHTLNESDFTAAREARDARRDAHYIFSAEGEAAWWAAYFEEDDVDDDIPLWEPPQQPIARTEPKIGRNDPCPCGSGRKYKKCHGAN